MHHGRQRGVKISFGFLKKIYMCKVRWKHHFCVQNQHWSFPEIWWLGISEDAPNEKHSKIVQSSCSSF